MTSNIYPFIITIILYSIYHELISAAAKVIPTTEEKEVPRIENNHMNTREKKRENNDDVQDNIMMPDGFIPQIESRNIITVPTYCPKGERKDSKGRCRTIM